VDIVCRGEGEYPVLFCSDEKFKSALMLAVNTGKRLNEMQPLKWKDVDLKRGVIILRDTENGETRQVPMNRTVLETVSALPHNNKEAYVFCKKGGNPYNFSSPFMRARKKAGIKDFRFHDLRHTAASYLVMKGVDLNTVREILGHKTLEMPLKYSHLSPAHKAREVSVLDEDMDTIRSPKVDVVELPKEV
jgi:integrase